MGVYYYFYNKTTGQDNAHPIFGQCKHVAKLNSIDDELVIQAFQLVISNNGWSKTDEIMAEADYPGHIMYSYIDGKLTYIESTEESLECCDNSSNESNIVDMVNNDLDIVVNNMLENQTTMLEYAYKFREACIN